MTLQPCFVVPEEHGSLFDRYFREIGSTASSWAVSTAKHGNGVHPLRDNDQGTFWQSDGVLPHTVDIVFPKLSHIVCVGILLHGRTDDSYTPKKMIIRASSGVGDLSEVASTETQSPHGWVTMQLTQDGSAPPDIKQSFYDFAKLHQQAAAEQLETGPCSFTNGLDLGAHRSPLGMFATHLQIVITENHQQGRDTHIRGIKVFAPHQVPAYQTSEFASGSEIR